MSSFRIHRSPYFYADNEKLRAYISEKHPDAQFVEEIALPTVGGGYTDNPGLVFYQEKPPEPYTNQYFAYFKKIDVHGMLDGTGDNSHWVIVGLDSFDPVVPAIIEVDDEGKGSLTISRYRHDFVRTPNGAFIDGGRDYLRLGGNPIPNTVNLNLLSKEFTLGGVTYNAN